MESEESGDRIPCAPSPPATALEDLRQKIIKQVEYYFSDENLPKDSFLLKHIMANSDGFVPIGIIASFRKMKKLTKDPSVIVAALRESMFLVVSSDGEGVKRLHPLSLTDAKDAQACTVLVENLPENHSLENLERIFSEAGKIKQITVRTPHDGKESQMLTVAEKLLSGKLHALVEYENVEAAKKAAATLNNEQDWRYGLRVKLLKKPSAIPANDHKKKTSKKLDPGKVSNRAQKSDIPGEDENCDTSIQHGDPHGVEDENETKQKNIMQHPKDKNEQKARGRGRRLNYHHANSHGVAPEPSKPPPGPRMPDGTRGFAMGRGQHLPSGGC